MDTFSIRFIKTRTKLNIEEDTMSTNRMFRGKPTDKLIIRIERDTIEAIDNSTRHRPGAHPGNRSEFVRQAIEAMLTKANV